MLHVFTKLTAGEEPDDQLDLRIHARCVSHREGPDVISSRNFDVDELAGGKPHLRRVDQTERDSAYRGCQVRDTLDDGLEGFDLITSEELFLGEAHRGDVDDTVGKGPAGAREGPASDAFGVSQREARPAVFEVPVGDQYLARSAPAMLASVAEEVSLGKCGAENGLAFGALDGAPEGSDPHLGHGHLPGLRGLGLSASALAQSTYCL